MKRILNVFLFLSLISHSLTIRSQTPGSEDQSEATTQTRRNSVALKTNLFVWLSTTPNLGVEFSTSNRFSIEIAAQYNPWKFGDNTSLRHWVIQPEAKWWLSKVFEKHYFGFHLIYGEYKIRNVPFLFDSEELRKYTYKGDVYGGGVTYGYSFIFDKRWRIELSLGIGYMISKHDVFRYDNFVKPYIDGTTHIHFGPTKVGINLVYIL